MNVVEAAELDVCCGLNVYEELDADGEGFSWGSASLIRVARYRARCRAR